MNREQEIVNKTAEPRTRASLARDLAALGLKPGDTVIVHTALSRIGWVCGRAIAVVQALMDALTPNGTLVMPAHSGDLSDPRYWSNPPVPESWQATIRETMPAYDPAITPTSGIGAVPEAFRQFPGVLRSGHPALSFTAWGRNAGFITDHHGLAFSLGESSPLARLYDLDGYVLLIGVGHDRNTSIHLAEYRADARPIQRQGAPVAENGVRLWKEYDDLEIDSDCFGEIGEAFERIYNVEKGRVGSAECRLMRQRQLVDFATDWFKSGHKA